MSNSGPRRRPMSTYLESRSSPHPQVPTQRSADNLLKSHHAPFQPSQPNMYPPPSEPAPPPPPRTVSQTAEALRRQALTDATSDVDTITVLQSLGFYSLPSPHTPPITRHSPCKHIHSHAQFIIYCSHCPKAQEKNDNVPRAARRCGPSPPTQSMQCLHMSGGTRETSSFCHSSMHARLEANVAFIV